MASQTSKYLSACVAVLAAGLLSVPARGQDAKPLARELLEASRISGGLCVQIGCGDGELTAALAADGRFLVHALDAEVAAVAAANSRLRAAGLYGQGWAECVPAGPLPYSENLVNLVVVRMGKSWPDFKEISRVLRPGGVLLAQMPPDVGAKDPPADAMDALRNRLTQAGLTDVKATGPAGLCLRAVKPWPKGMDDWGHPRHGPNGNAVSRDQVAGPVQRIRWICGPMHEVSNMVTAGGRFFYGGTTARDAFNGLRLWQRALDPTPMRLGFLSSAVPGSVLPVAVGERLYVVSEGKLQALDAATGKTVRVYAGERKPLEILHLAGTLVARDAEGVWAYEADSGKALWSAEVTSPTSLVADDGAVFCLEGKLLDRKSRAIVKLDLASGKVLWRRSDHDWLANVRRLACDRGLLVCEVSTYSDTRPGNGIHVLDAADGKQVWEHLFEPGQNHWLQARAMQVGQHVWVLAKGQWRGLDRTTGSIDQTHPGWYNHCFPPVATARYLLGGEMNHIEIATGRAGANQITKGNCDRDAGFVPANGLLYTSPKHCSCYPMLKGYSALAPAKPGAGPGEPKARDFSVERGPAWGTKVDATSASAGEWPGYRSDIWRSASAETAVPAKLEVLWTGEVGGWPNVPAAVDWKQNLYGRGPLTPPVAAGGLAVVAQIDGHRVVAFDAAAGKQKWEFAANGRIDTPPTLHGGLCIFGTRSGWAYCLRSADGQLVWRMRLGANEERMVSYGQLESPWPVAGSPLVLDGVLYMAAGRHPLADGGVRVLAMEPATGQVKRVKMITSLPMKNFYGGAALEFEPIDLLTAEARRAGEKGAPYITMSRWQLDPGGAETKVAWESGFALCRKGAGGVLVPRGVWTYGQRMQYLGSGPKPGQPDYIGQAPRPLAAFHGSTLVCSSEDKRTLFRRDFSEEDLASFNEKWFNQRHVPRGLKPGDRNRSERLAREAAWWRTVFPAGADRQEIAGVALAGERVFVVGSLGKLVALDLGEGKVLAERDVPPPIWDGLAAASGRLYLSTADGKIVCLGEK